MSFKFSGERRNGRNWTPPVRISASVPQCWSGAWHDHLSDHTPCRVMVQPGSRCFANHMPSQGTEAESATSQRLSGRIRQLVNDRRRLDEHKVLAAHSARERALPDRRIAGWLLHHGRSGIFFGRGKRLPHLLRRLTSIADANTMLSRSDPELCKLAGVGERLYLAI